MDYETPFITNSQNDKNTDYTSIQNIMFTQLNDITGKNFSETHGCLKSQ